MISAFEHKMDKKCLADKSEYLPIIKEEVKLNKNKNPSLTNKPKPLPKNNEEAQLKPIKSNNKNKRSKKKKKILKNKQEIISRGNILFGETSNNHICEKSDNEINTNHNNEIEISDNKLKKNKKSLKHLIKKTKLKKKKNNINKNKNFESFTTEGNLFDSFLTNENKPKDFDSYIFNVEIYEPHSDIIFLFLKEEDSFSFSGKAQLCCLVGAIEVLGNILDETNDAVPIYAPLCHPCISIANKCKRNHTSKFDILRKQLLKYCGNLNPGELTNILNRYNNEIFSVIILSKLQSKFVDFVCSFDPFQHLFKTQIEQEFNLYPPLFNSDIFFDQERISYINFLAEKQNQESNQIILLCGGKGSGKSTFCRYIANCFLNKCDDVMLLDCDVGQTEFQPPGFVGLNKIQKPLFGPGFTHPNEGLVKCFVGAVSPAFDPAHYLDCVKFVFKTYRDKYHHLPLLINTMGWTRDIGLSLLLHTIEMVKPTVVIQLESCIVRNNLPLIDANFINNPPKDIFIIKKLKSKTTVNFQHIIFPSVTKPMQGTGFIKISAKDFRDLMLLSHFFIESDSLLFDSSHSNISEDILKPPISITEDTSSIFSSVADDSIGWMPLVPLKSSPMMRVVRIQLENVALHVMHESIPPSLILVATNASFCSFACIDKDLIINSQLDGYPNFLEKNPVCESLGIGIIRSYDMRARCVYVSTCAKMESLIKTNCLLVGGVQLPKQLIITDKKSIAIDVDYVSYTRDSFGVAPLRPKGLSILRKRPYDFEN